MIDDKIIDSIRKEINLISLYRCEKVKCGDALYYQIENIDISKSFIYAIKYIFKFLIRTITTNNKFEVKGKPYVLFLFSNSYGTRKDLKENFERVLQLSQNYIYMSPEHKRTINIKPFNLCLIPLRWNQQCRYIIKNRMVRWKLLYDLYCAYIDFYEYQYFCLKQHYAVEKLVSNCDVHLVDSFFTQKFNLENKITISLQHGAYSSKIQNWSFLGSKSKYLLAHGKFTMEEGMLVSYQNTMIPVGLLSNIGVEEPKQPKIYQIEKIGLFLDAGKDNFEYNIKVIGFMQNFCEKNNFLLCLKFHPTTDVNDYKPYINESVLVYSNNISFWDFSNYIDIGIVSFSTVLSELLKRWIPVFIYYNKSYEKEMYTKFEYGRFDNEAKLLELIRDINTEQMKKYILEARAYYCTDGNTTENYKNAFRRLGIY